MRTIGATTNKICWELIIKCDDNIVFYENFKTLKDIAKHLNITYNVVSEMAMGRKKIRTGKYDTQYIFNRLDY